MRQVLQAMNSGELRYVDHPAPNIGPTDIQVAVRSSLISSGTERSIHELAGSSLARKAQARPDLVRAVVDRARREGIRKTVSTVQARLDQDMPIGYSAAGVIMAVGEAVRAFRPGDRVATAGAGHAEIQSVSGNLAARLPNGVSFDEGAFGAIASVALHGFRLADVGPGSKVAVIGLGLIGQLAVRLALAAGCEVAGTDLDDSKQQLAAASGAHVFPSTDDGSDSALEWANGSGVDAILVTAATKSSVPMKTAAHLARDRGTIVAIGDVGLDLDRRSLYEKELEVRVSRAYGPGRYDPTYEDLGIDYPIGYVRWPIGRNLDAVMGLVESGRLELNDLITHRFPFRSAVEAYGVLEGGDPYLGILLEYPTAVESEASSVRLARVSPAQSGRTGLASSLVGAGRFAAGVLLPAAKAAGFGPWIRIASAGGASAVRVGERNGFGEAVSTAESVVGATDTDVVFIASRHDSHAGIAAAALSSGKHVFCEKPLAITEDGLVRVVDAWNTGPGVLMVGFNRRWSPAVDEAVSFVGRSSPLEVVYRVHAGALPKDHWLNDRRQGGRLLGEGCHFIDTCNAITGEAPETVYAIASGESELLLREDFSIMLQYPSGSQAAIVYSAGAPRGAGKERIEIIRGQRSAEIEDFRTVTLHGAKQVDVVRYKHTDKGHDAELVAFREAVEGRRSADELAQFAVETTRVALAAVESLTTGRVVGLTWS